MKFREGPLTALARSNLDNLGRDGGGCGGGGERHGLPGLARGRGCRGGGEEVPEEGGAARAADHALLYRRVERLQLQHVLRKIIDIVDIS